MFTVETSSFLCEFIYIYIYILFYYRNMPFPGNIIKISKTSRSRLVLDLFCNEYLLFIQISVGYNQLCFQ